MRKAELTFPESGIAVIVGANGSGKTNVVRALEFIASVQQDGFSTAVMEQGGQRSILPKSISNAHLSETPIIVDYRTSLSPPQDYPDNAKPPSGRHTLRFLVGDVNDVHIERELLEFGQVLQVARAMESPLGTPATAENLPPFSSLRFAKRAGEDAVIRALPKGAERYVDEFVNWFGFKFLREQGATINSWSDILAVVTAIEKQLNSEKASNPRTSWLTDPLFSLCEHARVFKNSIRNTRRFELQVETLKSEQLPSRGESLHDTGSNLPSMVRKLNEDQTDRQPWERIKSTLRDIAPFVSDVDNDLLETGKEFVKFIESPSGRAVESWESSDGTVRALAILIAVETHPEFSTMIVEEPERGLHPWAVRYLTAHLREAAIRRNVQLVITTHSPEVLESCMPDEVVVATRSHETGTRLRLVSEILHLRDASPGDLGRLWMKGLIGGHPHDA